MNTETYTPPPGRPFLDPLPGGEEPLDYEDDNSSDSEWERLDLYDDLEEGDDDLEDDEFLDDTYE